MHTHGSIKLFPLQLHSGYLKLDESIRNTFIKEIDKQTINSSKDKDAWTGDLNNNNNLHENPVFQPLFKLLPTIINSYCKTLGIKIEKFNPYITRAWGTKSYPHQSISQHNHAYASLAFIYYPFVPENDKGLIIEDPSLANEIIPGLFIDESYNTLIEPCAATSKSVALPVTTDSFIIMPAKINHHTKENPDTIKCRYSIAVDIIMILKEATNVEPCLTPIHKWKLCNGI